jgi:hypothetical protein
MHKTNERSKSQKVENLDAVPTRTNFTRFFLIGAFLAAVLLNFPGVTPAQDTVTGAFQGKVSNNLNGATIGGATVVITNERTGETYTLITDSRGEFYQGLLAPGSYLISVEVANFKPRRIRMPLNVSRTGEVVPVPVLLEPETSGAPTSPTAAVVEEADSIRVEINTSDARRDGSYKDELLTRLPLGATTITRTFDELALFLPGIAPPPQTIGDVAGPGVGPGVGSAGQFAVNGLRSRGNNFTVDGSDNNDEDIGVRRQGFVALVPQPIESIKEFQIISLLAPAQFGRNIGAQVNAVSLSGGNKLNGAIYGFFNSDALNSKNYFDTKNGSDLFALRSASGQSVLLDGQPFTVRNQSNGEDSFTFGQFGGTLGGAIVPNRLFYFVSGEYQKINAVQEKNFAVPTIEQRGAFGTGATGTFRNPYTNDPIAAIPNTESSAALLSLFPFPNNPNGVYGANTFTQTLPASGRGVILSGRLDNNFAFAGRQHSFTARYNFTDDEKNISAVNEAIFSTVLSQIGTNNISLFLNSQLNKSGSSYNPLFNQIRFSFGRSRLKFDEVRDSEFLIQSARFPNIPFLLNAPLRFNITQPAVPGTPNAGAVSYLSANPRLANIRTAESILGPIGQVSIAGFSSLGTDVYNFPQNRINRTYQLADELTYRVARHSFAFGFDTRRTDLDSDLPRLARPFVSFNGSPRLTARTGANCPNGGVGNFCFPAAGDANPVIRAEDLAALGAASNFLLTFNVDRPDSKVNLRYYQLNFYAQDTWRVHPNLSLSYGLRYEYNTPVKETDNLIEKTFSDSRLALVPGLNRFVDGRTGLYEPDRNNFAPRVGLAYSPTLFGSRTSVFRVGYGIFYDQILGAVVNQSRNVFPTFLTVNFGGSIAIGEFLLNLRNPGALSIQLDNGTVVPVQLPGTINNFNPNVGLGLFIESNNAIYPNFINATLPARRLEMPMAHHYSFTFEQQLNSNFTVSAAYVGTAGRNLLRFTTPNLGSSLTTSPTRLVTSPIPTPFGTLNFPQNRGITFIPNRPVNSVGGINQFETTASSVYNALQTQFQGRFANSLDFQLSYTFSKVEDDVSDVFDLAGAFALPQNSMNLRAERAPANFDVRHRWAYNLLYSFPKVEGKWIGFFTDNLQIATTGKFRSGQPFTVNSTIDINLDGNLTDRLNTTNEIQITGDRRQPLRLTTGNTLALLAPFGQDGSVGRNSFRSGNVIEMDLSIIKPFVFGSNRLQFRTDIFNFINRANFGVPVRLLEAPGFGKAVSTVTPARRIQFSLKYEF